MAFANYVEILEYGKAHGIAIGAFNGLNMETIQAIAEAAEESDTPVIIQSYHAHVDFAGVEYLASLYNMAGKDKKVKLAMGLDHGQCIEQAKRCIDSGFTGVMIDLSTQDLDTNIRQTQKVVQLAHDNNVSVEAELGVIFTADQRPELIRAGYTDPAAARRFAEETQVDCLAVSIGTAHGLYRYKPEISFELLEELLATVPCPIAIHGGSGVPDDQVKRMVKMGILKFNVGTDLFYAYQKAFIESVGERTMGIAPELALKEAKNAVKKRVCDVIAVLNTYRTDFLPDP